MATLAPKDQDRIATIKSQVSAIINGTNLASSVAILVQSLDNHRLEHRGRVIALAYANIGVTGMLILATLAMAVLNLPDGKDKERYAMGTFFCLNFIIAALTAGSTGVSVALVAFSGSVNGTMTTS